MPASSLKPVLLSKEQVVALQAIQKSEREKSSLNIAPTIHVIARQLMDKALSQLEGGEAWSN
ncbi:hypothetical protein AI29_13795 [bacteria symbiont BFo2 of Frankliniella occidentalis]|nr:hypothetical protein AI29_13795 [bacteria symbiont BFo2 of Frankliniella occidentalis]KYP92537.1 prophage protein [bacteria symbiont BFo2 of Frankliniella occidentalis]KYP94200.1 prophage protein [bacteria symbiont BFo2 of Frankliniella occidentalis]